MQLTTLIAAIGQRKESPAVEALVIQLGGKVPLPSKREGYFTAKKHHVGLAWNTEVLTPAFYPPKKEGRKEISYVTTIWFPSEGVSFEGLPAQFLAISARTTAEEWAAFPGVSVVRNAFLGHTTYQIPAGQHAELLVTFNEDGKAEKSWTLAIREHSRYAFVRSSARSHAFSPWDPAWPDEQADLPMGMFMAWCIDRNRIGARHLNDHAELVHAVRSRQMTGREFLYRVAYCNEVWSWDVSQDAQAFAHTYLHCLCHRNSSTPLLGREDRCGVDDDFMAVFSPHFKGRGLEAGDTWDNYERFAVFLDARFRDHELTALETDLPAGTLRQVTEVYREAQARMDRLPPARSHRELTEPASGTAAPPPKACPAATAPLTPRLLTLFGKLTTEPEVLALANELQLRIPSVSWNTYIDAPEQGFFLDLVQPWNHERLGVDFAAAKGALQRKKVKLVESIRFTAEGYSNVSNSTGSYLLCSGFQDALPLGFHFEEPLAAADQRLGEDVFQEHTWETYEGDGSLTRRWTATDVTGAPEGDYLVIADYEKHRLVCLRLVLK